MAEPIIIIKKERGGMFQNRHPWIFSGAIRSVQGEPADGDIVTLRGESGQLLARGDWNHHAQINVNALAWDEHETIDDTFWTARLERAIAARSLENALHKAGSPNAYRLGNAENDAIPGLVVDRYADWLVVQALTKGIYQRKATLARLLMERLEPAGMYERSDVEVRRKEGLTQVTGVLLGQEPAALVEIEENGRRFLVDVHAGHKTGFYPDQRENRDVFGTWLRDDESVPERTVLNCFSYSGGFSVYALGAAAQVTSIDASADALVLAQRNIAANGFDALKSELVEGDVFEVLREYRTAKRQFDVVILDPPKFANNQRQIEAAARGYKDINLLAFQLIKPAGTLITFSCSGLVDAHLFQQIVFGALVDSHSDGQIVRRLTAAADHPVALTFPEGMYLKGLWCRVW